MTLSSVLDPNGAQFHSDDENGVYPFVVGLSLGSDALMKFRCKGSSKVKQKPFLSLNIRHVSST